MSGLTLTTIAQEINREHATAHAEARSALERARRCGELLTEAKAKVEHGGWLPWIEANLAFGARQAQKYMSLAEKWDRLPNANSNSLLPSTIDAALAAVADITSVSSHAGYTAADITTTNSGNGYTAPHIAGADAYSRKTRVLISREKAWHGAIAADLQKALDLCASRKAAMPSDPADWTLEDAAACAANIRAIDDVFHHHGICSRHNCTACEAEVAQ